jgi:diguanylate cyclase (GGDEF)-like protein
MSSSERSIHDIGGTLRVLAVGDGPPLNLIAEQLSHQFDVQVSSPLQASEALADSASMAVVLAASDGTWDAVEFLAACRRDRPSVRRILLVSELSGAMLHRAVNNGGAHYILRRPINPDELVDAVRRLAGDFNDDRLLKQSATRRGDGSLATKDRLTGLYNHRSFQERLREELARARRYAQSVSVLLGDIDNFSELNRAAGYRCGDEVLQRVASILRSETSSVRECDITSRYGGQQFAIILPETDKEGAVTKAERLRESIGDEILPDGVSITMSFGISTFPADTDNAATMLLYSEQSLQEAKRQGRNRVQPYRSDMEDRPPVLNVHAETFPTFHARLGDLVHNLERDGTLACLFIDLSRMRRVEQEFGVAQHNQLLARAGEILMRMRGGKLRREDLLCRTADGDGYLCFVSPPRFDGGSAPDLSILVERLTVALESGLAEAMRSLTRDMPQVAVGTGRVINNPMIRGERLIHRLVDEARETAGLAWAQTSREHKEILQNLILGQELRTAFQPIVNLATGEPFAYEALTRGPEDSTLGNPTALFSVASAVDLTVELDRACFRTALHSARGCEPFHRLFLNLLPQSYYDTHFIEHDVVSLLDNAGLTPANLVFEVTERLAIENFTAFRQALSRYTDMGFGVAVDDVGTRHSNLESVMALRPHFIKLSEILCRGVAHSTVKREMVRSLVRIAETIDAVTVAEGIESLEDLDTLRDLGARFGQGYFLARPAFEFPKVDEHALAALSARPGNGEAAGSHSTEPHFVNENHWHPLAGDEDDSEPSLREGLLREGTSSTDGFEDEPTRTRGTLN